VKQAAGQGQLYCRRRKEQGKSEIKLDLAIIFISIIAKIAEWLHFGSSNVLFGP
jgi:hypothetical protein